MTLSRGGVLSLNWGVFTPPLKRYRCHRALVSKSYRSQLDGHLSRGDIMLLIPMT